MIKTVREKRPSRKVSVKFTPDNHVQLVRGGKEYFDLLLKLIHEAQETIHLQTYIFDDDETGRMVADALMGAARRKVAVYVLIDGYASRHISHEFVQEIRATGVYFRFFEPLFKSSNFYFGRRLHHKIFVADARHSLIGGINISNRYNDMEDEPAWLDFGLYAYGRAAREFCVLCSNTWKGFSTSIKILPCPGFKNVDGKVHSDSALVRIRRNDWVRGRNQISWSYLRALRRAKSHMIIMSSYFLPGEGFKVALRKAAKRGVKIQVVVAGLSDVVIAKNAERYIYDWLLRNGIEIYEVQGRVLHAKVAVCDGHWMTIGSYNVNDISAHASIEANVDIMDPRFVSGAEEVLREIIRNDCVLVTPSRHGKTKNIVRQLLRWLAYQTIRVLLFMFTFYFKRKRED
ncbi:MAG TPA: phospholipase D-like domain-containing protein [Chitinophagaceae bacterium]|nr:phospholipase D-like domain-containing protein [Chitinophagaceae bacterium]